MKTLAFIAVLSTGLATLAPADPLVPDVPAAPPSDSPPSIEFKQLQQEFARRRAEALRPVTSWYRAQLEALRRTERSPEAQDAIARALAETRETFWQDDQPELRQALLAQPWVWRSADDAEGVVTTFHVDGSVAHIGMRGTWRITGPSEVTVSTEDKERFVLRFNASLSAYEADRRNVSGHRVASVR